MANILQNYNENFISTEKEIVNCYNTLIYEYISTINEHIKTPDNTHNKFIILRGIDTITHCFNLLFIYSKNIDIIKNNCKKAICYYVEFIGQIGEDSNSFLQLNSKDAALFVYKKIIFDIDQNYRKTFELTSNEKSFIHKIKVHIELVKQLNMKLFLFSPTKTIEDKYNTYISLKNKINAIFNRIIKYDFNTDNLEIIIFFITYMSECITDEINYINMINCFVKKLHNKNINIISLQKKLFENNNIINEKQHIKFVNWLFII